MLANAVVNVAEVFLARVSFDSGNFGFGLLWTASGVGLVVGGLFASTWLERRSVSFVYGAGLALMAFGAAGHRAARPNVWVAAAAWRSAASATAARSSATSLLVQRGAPTSCAAAPSR